MTNIHVPYWVPIDWPDFAKSNTSAANPSNGSVTLLSTMTMRGTDVPGGVVVTTLALAPDDYTSVFMLRVNGTDVNAEGGHGTITSVMTLTPSSTLSALAVDRYSDTSIQAETNTVTVPWYASMNTIQVLGFNANGSLFTFQSSHATGASSRIY